MGHRPSVEAGQQVVDGHVGHALARRMGRRANVRNHEQVRGSEQGMIRRKRLWIRHIQRGTGQLAYMQRSGERICVDDRATRCVHEI
jgi:hypothetical protein